MPAGCTAVLPRSSFVNLLREYTPGLDQGLRRALGSCPGTPSASWEGQETVEGLVSYTQGQWGMVQGGAVG